MTGMLISAFALLAAAGAGLVCEMQRIHHFQRAVANMRLGRTLSTQSSLTTSSRYRRARNLLTAAALAAVVVFLASGMLS